jgi:hypothetical protein
MGEGITSLWGELSQTVAYSVPPFVAAGAEAGGRFTESFGARRAPAVRNADNG